MKILNQVEVLKEGWRVVLRDEAIDLVMAHNDSLYTVCDSGQFELWIFLENFMVMTEIN